MSQFFISIQPSLNEADRPENVPQTQPGTEQLSLPIQSSDEPEELEGAVGGAATDADQDLSSVEWMLSAGIEDPDLMGKIRCNYKDMLQKVFLNVTACFSMV